MNGALTASADAARMRDLMPELGKVLPAVICPLIVAYTGDARRLFFEGLFQFSHRAIGSRADINADGTTYVFSTLNTSRMIEWWTIHFNSHTGQLRCRAGCDAIPFASIHRPELYAGVRIPSAQELWDFACGDDSPAIASVVDKCTQTVPTHIIIDHIRHSLRQKAARWCAMHECAAIARIWLGRPREPREPKR